MPTEHLTARTVETASPPEKGVREIVDGHTRGLVLRITSNGVKSWGMRYRFNGKPKRLALGRYPDMKLKDAREEVGKARQKIRDGVDPARKAEEAEAPTITTVADAVDRFVASQEAKGRRSAGEQARVLRLHLVPKLGQRDIRSIERRDLYQILERMRNARGDDGAPLYGPQVNRVLTQAKTFFGWAVEAGEVDDNPAAAIKRFVEEKSRERVLSGDELARVIHAADKRGQPVAALIRLLVLTGQRREEVTRMEWAELDLEAGIWTIPASRTKAKREHKVPLSTAAVAILETVPSYHNCPYVVPGSTRDAPWQGWVKAARFLKKHAGLDEPWTIHDIRRSVATGLGEELGVEESMISRILNHSARSRLGITATYERSERLEPMRNILEAWAGHVDALLAGDEPSANVVHLRGAEAKA